MRRALIVVVLLLIIFYFCSWKNAIAQSANFWSVPIRIQIGNNNFNLYFGMRPNATAGFDAGVDTLAAPPPPATPYAYFPLATFPNFLQADYRGAASSSLWNLRIVNTGGATSTVSWNTSQVPATVSALFIVSLRDTLNMLQVKTKSYVGDQNLKINFPNPVSVFSRSTDPVPVLFELRAYPNPFVTATTLVVNAPASRAIVVRIFNLLGEEIRTFNRMPVSFGVFQIHWDGLDANGISVPSGVYFCQLETRGVSIWRKLYRLR